MNDQSIHRNFVLLLSAAVMLMLGCALGDIPAPTPLAFPTIALPNTASTFDHNSLVGQPAPGFTLMDTNGQPYTFRPNDGRKHVIVFYMGYTWGLCVSQLGELEKKMGDLKPLADVTAIGADTPASIQQLQATTKASFPLLRDPDLKVAKQFDMQLRANWPMGMMGSFPEMGYVIVDEKGIIRAQRVDLNFGDHVNEMIILLKKS